MNAETDETEKVFGIVGVSACGSLIFGGEWGSFILRVTDDGAVLRSPCAVTQGDAQRLEAANDRWRRTLDGGRDDRT